MNNEWTIDKINQMLDNDEPESQYLEYKASQWLTEKDKQDMKNILIKHITAFANAGGGLIIIGIIKDQKTSKYQIDKGLNHKEYSQESLSQIIYSNIKPKIMNIIITPIPLIGSQNIIYTIDIPQSFNGPHQAIDRKYYVRRNSTIEAMEDYEIRDIFNRRESPNVELDIYFSRHNRKITEFPLDLSNPKVEHTLEINGNLKNIGGGIVNHAIIKLYLDSRLRPEFSKIHPPFNDLIFVLDNDKEINVSYILIKWGGINYFPLFKGAEYFLLNHEINIHFKSNYFNDDIIPFILFEIIAPGMQNKISLKELVLTKGSITIKEKRPFIIKKIIKKDIPEEFFYNYDLTLDPSDGFKY